jgi:hypothetical protein
MNNKIELLRAIWFTEKDSPSSSGDFSDGDKKLVEMFKKIYELGKTPHLEGFIKELNTQAATGDLDTHTVNYFKNILKRGPFGKDAEQFITAVVDNDGNNNIKDISDNIGINVDSYNTMQNMYFFEGVHSQGCSQNQYRKLPKFMGVTLHDAITKTETLFNDNMYAVVVTDNTLPLQDKKNQRRYDMETNGGSISLESHANYCTKDRYFYVKQQAASDECAKSIKKYLKKSRNSYLDSMKKYNPFNADTNQSITPTSKTMSITEKIKVFNEDGKEEKEETFKLDLMLDLIVDSESINKHPTTNDKNFKSE